MNKEEFISELEKLNITITQAQMQALEIYKDMLKEYNAKFNLTAITLDEDIYLKHFYDSLTLVKAINLNENLKLLDIGTGAGFQGLVLKIVFTNLDVTLIDSNTKKISFLEEVIKKLKLNNVVCLNNRIENLDESYYEYFDIITSRAVANLSILSELSTAFLKVQGYFIPMKANITKELEESSATLKILNYKLIDLIKFTLPKTNDNRTIIKLEKTAKTPNIYPRPYNQILKHPLK